MSVQKISSRQIFGVKREGLEKRIIKEYTETKDVTALIQFAFALLMRNAITVKDFSGMLIEIIHDVFLFSEPCEILHNFAPFFRSYFNEGEWEEVVARLYTSKEDYASLLDKISPIKELLDEKTTPIEELGDQKYKISAVFTNEHGKRHSWTLQDADPNVTSEKFQVIALLLSSMTVFKKDGARLFQEVQSAYVMNCTKRTLIKKEQEPKKIIDQNATMEDTEAVNDADIESIAEKSQAESKQEVSVQSNEKEEELSISLPEGVTIDNLNQEELLDIVKKQLPEGALLTGVRIGDEELLKRDLLQPPIDLTDKSSPFHDALPLPTQEPVKDKQKSGKKEKSGKALKQPTEKKRKKKKRQKNKDNRKKKKK